MQMEIKDLEKFKAACEQHNVSYKENTDAHFTMSGSRVKGILTDMAPTSQGRWGGGGNAYLVETEKPGVYKLSIDNDVYYSTLSARLGKNGGKLTRDYTTSVVLDGVRKQGGMLLGQQEQPDGSVILKVSAVG